MLKNNLVRATNMLRSIEENSKSEFRGQKEDISPPEGVKTESVILKV